MSPCFTGDIGGQMGLFLGASIITISEFLEFITVFILTKCKGKNSVNTSPSATTQVQKF